MATIPAGTSEVVRYLGKEPHGWLTRGTLARVVTRFANGKLRVGNIKGVGTLQYVDAKNVETVGEFPNTMVFGGDFAPEMDEGELSEPIAEEPVADPQPIQDEPVAESTENAPISDSTTTPMDFGGAVSDELSDIRELIRDEIKRQLREMVAGMVRQEIARYFGANG